MVHSLLRRHFRTGFLLAGVELIYTVVLVFVALHRDSAMQIHGLLYHGILQDVEYSSPCY